MMWRTDRKTPPPFPLTKSERQGRFFFLLATAGVALWMLLGSWGGKAIPSLGTPCTFRQVTGLPCSLCGGTRATRSIFQGDFEKAMYLNPLAFPILAGGLLLGICLLYESISGKALLPRLPTRSRLILVGIGGGFLIIWSCWHAWDAIRTPKPELTNLSHPLVKFLREKSGTLSKD